MVLASRGIIPANISRYIHRVVSCAIAVRVHSLSGNGITARFQWGDSSVFINFFFFLNPLSQHPP